MAVAGEDDTSSEVAQPQTEPVGLVDPDPIDLDPIG